MTAPNSPPTDAPRWVYLGPNGPVMPDGSAPPPVRTPEEAAALIAALSADSTAVAEPVEVLEDNDGEMRVRLPVVVIEGQDTSDGRFLKPGSLSPRALPLSLLAQPRAPHGGDNPPAAEVIGRIDSLIRVPGPEVMSKRTGQPFPDGTFIWSGEGVIDAEGEIAELVRKRYLRGVSVDLAGMDFEVVGEEGFAPDPDNPRRQVITHAAEIAAVTLVPIPAFGDCYVELADEDVTPEPIPAEELPEGLMASAVPAWRSTELGDAVVAAAPPSAKQRGKAEEDGDTYPGTDRFPIDTRERAKSAVELHGSSDIPAEKVKAWLKRRLKAKGWEDLIPDDWQDNAAANKESVTASADTPALPPIEWFRDPELPALTPLTVEADGRVYGHLAGWSSTHTGFPGRNINPPRSASDYAYFHAGAAQVRDGDNVVEISVGHLTMDTSHASTDLGQHAAVSHYDHTGSLVANVCVGEDAHGIWFSGAVLPEVDDLKLHRFRSCGLSGDWRRIGTGLELVAALSVPVPGFPVPRARVASGQPLALVAAGALRPDDAPRADGAVVLDYDILAEAIATRLDERRAAGELSAEHAALVAELDDTPAVVAALLAEVDDSPQRMAELLAELDEDVGAFDISQMPKQLQESYLRGEVAARIRWGTSGDWRRCVAQAKVHGMGRKAEGACATLHKKANGFYPGDKRNK